MKIITNLEPVNTKIKVYINGEKAFMLYKSEIRKFNISVGCEISEETFNKLMSLLYNRAKERALYLLDKSYKTEKEIYDKLKSGLYPDIIIGKVLEYLREYDLVNDLRYSLMYIDFKRNSKSKKQIIQELYKKGIAKDIIDISLEKSNISDEISLDNVVAKRINKYDVNDYKSIGKLFQYLVGKGYNYSDIKVAISKYTNVIN